MLVLVNWKSLSFSVPKFCNEVSLRADTSLVTFLQSAKLPMCNVNIRNIPISNCFFFSRSHTLSKITACLLQTQIVYYYSVIWKKNESFCTAAKKLAEKVQLLLEIVLETSLGFVERELPNVTKKLEILSFLRGFYVLFTLEALHMTLNKLEPICMH